MRRRRQKNDRRDVQHLLDLLTRGEFPTVWRFTPRAGTLQRQSFSDRRVIF